MNLHSRSCPDCALIYGRLIAKARIEWTVYLRYECDAGHQWTVAVNTSQEASERLWREVYRTPMDYRLPGAF